MSEAALLAAQWEDAVLGQMLAALLVIPVVVLYLWAEWKASEGDRETRRADGGGRWPTA